MYVLKCDKCGRSYHAIDNIDRGCYKLQFDGIVNTRCMGILRGQENTSVQDVVWVLDILDVLWKEHKINWLERGNLCRSIHAKF